jgi:hypothetical protein
VSLYVNIPATGWTRVDVSSNKQDQDFTVDGQSYTIAEFIGYVPNNNAAAATLTLQPNAVSTGQSAKEIAFDSAVGGANYATLYVGLAPASGFMQFNLRVLLKTGTKRYTSGDYTYVASTDVVTGISTTRGQWTDTTTAITSLRFHSDRADGIKAGSVFWYRLTP